MGLKRRKTVMVIVPAPGDAGTGARRPAGRGSGGLTPSSWGTRPAVGGEQDPTAAEAVEPVVEPAEEPSSPW